MRDNLLAFVVAAAAGFYAWAIGLTIPDAYAIPLIVALIIGFVTSYVGLVMFQWRQRERNRKWDTRLDDLENASRVHHRSPSRPRDSASS